MNRLLALAVSVVAVSAFASDAWQKRVQDYRSKLAAERAKLGLDKKKQAYPTPEVKFVGAASDDGVLGVLCPGKPLQVTLDGVPPKSLVTPNVDGVEVSKESWAGQKWTGTLTAKPDAVSRSFGLVAVYATTGQEAYASSWVIGCKRTLTLTVEDATLTLSFELKSTQQPVTATGEWKKGGKTLGTRPYEVSLTDSGVHVSSQDPADMDRLQKAMVASQSSPKAQALNKRFEEAMKKLEACSKQPPAKMPACMQAVQPDIEKVNAERKTLTEEADRAAAPTFGCLRLHAMESDSSAEACAGHLSNEQLPVKASWN